MIDYRALAFLAAFFVGLIIHELLASPKKDSLEAATAPDG